MSKNDIFTDPKYASVDGNIYHDTIFDNSKGKNNKAKVQEPVYSDDGETLVLLCSLLVPLFKKIFPATDIQKEVQ